MKIECGSEPIEKCKTEPLKGLRSWHYNGDFGAREGLPIPCRTARKNQERGEGVMSFSQKRQGLDRDPDMTRRSINGRPL
jgi:hypothetical protein